MKAGFRWIGTAIAVAMILVISMCSRFVWLPDLSGRINVLASAQAVDGNRFRVLQSWGYDFYQTVLEQISPDGKISVAVIDSDDCKQWSAVIKVIDAEKKLIVAVPAGTEPFEYRWDQKGFVLPPGRARLRD